MSSLEEEFFEVDFQKGVEERPLQTGPWGM